MSSFNSPTLYRLIGELVKSNPDRQTQHRADKRFAEHIQQEYLVKLTSPGKVDLEPKDAATVKAHVARLKIDNIDISTDEGKDPDAEKHSRSVKLAKKKPPFNADQPAVAYNEDGHWEDRSITLGGTECQSCNNVLDLSDKFPQDAQSRLHKIIPFSAALRALVEIKRQIARSTTSEQSPLSGSAIHTTTTVTHSTFARSDRWLNDDVVNNYMDLLASTQAPTTAVNLGSYFTMMKEPNQRGGILRRQGVSLLDIDLAFLPVNSALHWTVFVMRPKARFVRYYNSFGNEDTDWKEKVERWVEEQLGRGYLAKGWRWEQGKSPAQEEMRRLAACSPAFNAFCACISRDPLTVYGQAYILQLRDHIGGVILNGGYVGELAIRGLTAV